MSCFPISSWASTLFTTTRASSNPSTHWAYEPLSLSGDDSKSGTYQPSITSISSTDDTRSQSGETTRGKIRASLSRFGRSLWNTIQETAHRVVSPDDEEVDAEIRAHEAALQAALDERDRRNGVNRSSGISMDSGALVKRQGGE